jgi:hypothetical protein
MKPALAGPSLFVLLLAAPAARAEVEIPTVGQPSPFYGAAGRKVTAEATAEPTDLTLDDTIAFNLRIRNLDNAPDVRRPDLGELEAFRDFQVDDDPTPEAEPAGTRVFRYHLRPRRATLTAIPAVVFPYYDPREPQPPDRPDFPFRKARTEPIPIRVRKTAPPPAAVVPLDVPAFAAAPATGSPTDVPRWVWWLAAALPPGAAVGGCAVWQVLNPAGARLARRRRSRAARSALKTLHALGRHPPADPALVVAAVAAYLAERHDLPGLFRTPGDLARRLREAGADANTAAECEGFLREADAARFAPAPEVTGEALIADAERLIRRQEGEA